MEVTGASGCSATQSDRPSIEGQWEAMAAYGQEDKFGGQARPAAPLQSGPRVVLLKHPEMTRRQAGSACYDRSITSAIPCPTPMHIVHSA